MWKTLKEGLQEFSRDALRETTHIKSVVDKVVPVTKSLASGEVLGKRFRAESSRDTQFAANNAQALDDSRDDDGTNEEEEEEEPGEGWAVGLSPLAVISHGGEGWDNLSADATFDSVPLEIHSTLPEASDTSDGETGKAFEPDVPAEVKSKAGANGKSQPDLPVHDVHQRTPVGSASAPEVVASASGEKIPGGNSTEALQAQRPTAGLPATGGLDAKAEDGVPTEAFAAAVAASQQTKRNAGGASSNEAEVGTKPSISRDGEATVAMAASVEDTQAVQRLAVLKERELRAKAAATQEAEALAKQVQEARQRAKREAAEAERFKALCDQLRASLEEALGERGDLAGRVSALEDELEEARAEAVRLEAEVGELESAGAEASRMAEEELQAAQGDYRKLHDRMQAAEAKAIKNEKDAAAARKEKEAVEQRLKMTTATLEKKIAGLNADLQSRQKEADKVRKETEEMEKAFTELRELLKQAVAERDGLVDNSAERERLLEELRVDLEKAENEVDIARREALETSMALAEAAAEVRAAREAAVAKALGDDERQQLEAACKTAAAAARASAEEAQGWQEKCVALERESNSRGRHLAQAEADLAVANQRALAAEADAEEARRLRAEAEGTTEQLREQTERRAKIFNAAVKAAVNKIQVDLESARDEALERVEALVADAHAHREEQRGLQEQARALMESLRAAQVEVTQLKEETAALCKQQAEAERELSDLRAQERAAAEGAKEAARATATQAASMEALRQQLEADVEAERAALKAEQERAAAASVSAARDQAALKADVATALAKASEEAASLKARIRELEGRSSGYENGLETGPVRSTDSGGQASAVRPLQPAGAREGSAADKRSGVAPRAAVTKNALEYLELDKSREARLLVRDHQDEAAGEALLGGPKGRRSAKRDPRDLLGGSGSWLQRRSALEEVERGPTGRISRRSFLIGLYIMLLHIMVMLSFTRSRPWTEISSGEKVMVLPGR
eukprot:TRINITY_DN1675_c2_g1_i1.p1 TRINITY_DN1675_c2_g1~~TRINITY_DN1675_c2_g1_i1.p1  ORF type:complete len:983 (+),score=280.88 TRINITY_DN1675_c2_g1_i1:375-3323(+)